MSDEVAENEIQVLGTAPKRLTYGDIVKKLKGSPLEIWLKLLKTRYSHSAMEYIDWIKAIDAMGREKC